nr:hypothetical protein Hi04_10k_c5591_00007 [uncultured bacterium]
MRVTSLGHAALYIETADQRVLVDPVFEESLVGGAVRYHPRRRLELARLPRPTALVVTHAHFDHFHPPSLAVLEKDVPVFIPEAPELLEGLRRLGFRNIQVCAPWELVTLRATTLLPTPSSHEEPEFGLFVSEGGTSFWHMADSEVTPEISRRLLAHVPRIDVVSVKYQPVVRASMGYQRSAGARFDKQEVVEWLEAACAVEPRFAFPYASGLCFAGRHAWFNRYAFPLTAEEVARLLGERLGANRAGVLDPGDVVEVTADEAPRRFPAASTFVASVAEQPVAWEPIETATLTGLTSHDDRAELERRLDAFVEQRLMPWLGRELSRPDSPWRSRGELGVVWQLVVELGDGQRLERHVDYRAEPLRFETGRHAGANSFTHVAARCLLDVLRADAPGLLFWLTGEARSYEKVFSVRQGRLFAERSRPPEDEPADPLTYFLRRFGPDAEGTPTAKLTVTPAEPELDLMSRAGENSGVLQKKALLCWLATSEVERRGIPIRDEDVQATSDSFRASFGLGDGDRTMAWMRQIGLDLADYTRVMRAFRATEVIQSECATEYASLAEAHLKVASARHFSR